MAQGFWEQTKSELTPWDVHFEKSISIPSDQKMTILQLVHYFCCARNRVLNARSAARTARSGPQQLATAGPPARRRCNSLQPESLGQAMQRHRPSSPGTDAPLSMRQATRPPRSLATNDRCLRLRRPGRWTGTLGRTRPARRTRACGARTSSLSPSLRPAVMTPRSPASFLSGGCVGESR